MTPPPARPSVHLSIDVSDLAAGLDFYGTVCGFRETARPFPTMAVVDGGNLSICIHEKPAGSPSSGEGSPRRDYARHWTPVHMDIHVVDFEETLLRISAAGGAIERTFRDTGPRPVAFCADPFGNGFCVIGPRPAAGAGARVSSTLGSPA
jgi:predicted enzyme related to lactoylglutathione lyase